MKQMAATKLLYEEYDGWREQYLSVTLCWYECMGPNKCSDRRADRQRLQKCPAADSPRWAWRDGKGTAVMGSALARSRHFWVTELGLRKSFFAKTHVKHKRSQLAELAFTSTMEPATNEHDLVEHATDDHDAT